jgi:iron(III) transport system permease protein
MRHIVMPMLRWPLAVSWLMLFAVFMRELGATILLYARGTETISVAMVVLSESGAGYVAALGVVQLMILLLAFLLVQFSRASLTQRSAGALPA